MHYLILLYGDEAGATEPGTPEFAAEMAGYEAFGELAAEAIRGGAALQLVDTARHVRHDGDEVVVTDGPYAEATEVLGGYYVLEADHLDEVIDLVRHIPATSAPGGGSEIRPLVSFNDFKGLDEAGMGRTTLATLHGPQAEARDHEAFVAAHRDQVAVGAALDPTAAATTVRVVDGEVLVSDGPYAEALEVAGGLYVLDAGDHTERLATEVPVGDGGIVELRPVMDLSAIA